MSVSRRLVRRGTPRFERIDSSIPERFTKYEFVTSPVATETFDTARAQLGEEGVCRDHKRTGKKRDESNRRHDDGDVLSDG